MSKRAMATFVMCVVAMLVVAAAAAQDLSGKWTMKVSGGPHGDTAMGLVLKQDGEKVSALFNPGHGDDIALTGTVTKGALALTSEAADDGSRITMKATMKSDGTLSGFMSSMMGDMTWTAARDKSK